MPPTLVEFGERNFALFNIWRSASGFGLCCQRTERVNELFVRKVNHRLPKND